MTKIKIAAIIACMLATGAFAGFTYQAANNNDDEKVTVITVPEEAEEIIDDEIVTDEETTDEEVTDEETTADEMTAEETIVIEIVDNEEEEEPAVTSAPAETAAPAPAPTVAHYEAPAAEYYEEVEPDPETETETTTTMQTEAETEPAVVNSGDIVTEAPAEDEPQVSDTTTTTKATTTTTKATTTSKESKRVVKVTDEEYVWLCNLVGREYGANWISEYEKAKVVEVVMNRVNDPRFPNTIYGVLTQKNQFSGASSLMTKNYTSKVTSSVKAAVDLYLEHPEQFQHGYLGFWGDGKTNHFYTM